MTERGVYRRDPDGLTFLDEPVEGDPSALASPIWYAPDVDPGHFDEGHETS